jgi:hypothetical protein
MDTIEALRFRERCRRSASQPIDEEPKPLMGCFRHLLEPSYEIEAKVTVSGSLEIDGVGNYFPSLFSEDAHCAWHVKGRGDQDPGFLRLRLE